MQRVILRAALATAVLGGSASSFAQTAPASDEPLPSGVTAKVVTFYSEHVPCYGRIFFPKGFRAEGKTPGVVLAHGWTATARNLEQYGARFAARGLVAMAIDYRGWGKSGGFVRLAEPVRTDDRLRFTPVTAKVRIKRTRLVPEYQVEDIRNAISYLQGEVGVDPDRIGLWGSSFAGGHVITVAARDARVKAGVAQVPSIAGKGAAKAAFELRGAMLEDAIRRARTGQGGTFRTGFDQPGVSTSLVMVDNETQQAAAEYQPFLEVEDIPATTAILFITAAREELFRNEDHAGSAVKLLKGPTRLVEMPDIGHFDIYRGQHLEASAKLAADWFLQYLTAK